MLFASDFPTDKLFASFAQVTETFVEVASEFGEDEQRALFAGNANRVYRLGLAV